MKHLIALTYVSVVLGFSAFGQGVNQAPIPKCHTYEMQQKLFEERPDIALRAKELDRRFDRYVKTVPNGWYDRKDGDPFIIPVVFHVVHDYGDENISNAQVENAVMAMTWDFNAQNPDLASVNQAFADIVGNVGIEFRLARIDPDGNCTNGVVRTPSPLTYSGGENLKEVSPIWDRSKYLNIWVCKNIASGAAGYTYYPSSLDGDFGETNDGIVVRYDYVGSIGASSPGLEHTLTHEVGHWINLPHAWGSTNEPGLAENCDSDDGVEDTPNTIGWTQCIPSGESCGSLDNVENFMEYAYCSKMFTEGQKTRMLAALNDVVAERSSLWQEDNLVATGVYDPPELCQASFASGKRTVCQGQTVDFSDQSYGGIASRQWIFDGGSPAGSVDINPVITYNEPGLYSVALMVSDSFGQTLTKVETAYVHVLDTAVLGFPQVEDFEAGQVGVGIQGVPWFESGYADDNQWEITDEAGYSGQKSARIVDTAPASGQRRTLASQTYTLTGVEVPPIVTFKYAAAARSQNADAKLRVYVSRNCGLDWNVRTTLEGEDLFTAEPIDGSEVFVPSGPQDWATGSAELLSDIYLTPEFRVRFVFYSGDANAVYLDDINLDFDPATGTSNPSNALSKLSVYPNPTSGKVTLKIGNLPEGDIAIYDPIGRRLRGVAVSPVGEGAFELDFEGRPAGVYFVHVGPQMIRVVKQP